MKFRFVISKWANFYFFVSVLSGCKNRKDYMSLWQKEIGPLSLKEKQALKKFRNLHKKYHNDKIYLWNYFFVENKNPLERKLKKDIPIKDFRFIQKTFDSFKKKFNQLYEIDYPLLKKWREALSNYSLNKNSPKKEILKILSFLYCTPIPKGKTEIYLLFSGDQSVGGSFHYGRDRIALEISRLSLREIDRAIGIIWHEFIHLYFDHGYFISLIKRLVKDERVVHYVKEAAASSLFPRGILGKRFLSIPSSNKQLHYIFNSNIASKILTLSREYIYKKRGFDENYIKKILKILRK